jgi:cytochrome P450 family 110
MTSSEIASGVPCSLPDGPFLDEDALWRLDEDPATVLADLARRYGDIFTIHRPEAPARVVLTTGEHIRELASRDPDLHSCGTSQFAQLVGEHSVNMLSGEPHRRMRQLLHPSFHARAVSSRVSHIRRIIREEFDRLAPTHPLPLTTFTGNTALRVITSVLFSSVPEAEVQDVCDTLLELVDGVHQYRAVPPAQRDAESDTTAALRFRERRTRLDHHLLALIAAYRARPAAEPTDLLGHLVTPPAALSDAQIRDQLVTMLVAGHLTTAASLAVAAYWLHQPHAHADEAIAELDALAANASDASAAQMAALRHLAAFCDEVLRIGSVVPHSAARRTPSDLTAFGHRLPAGTELVVSIHLAHRRPETYPEPEAFRPSRFIDARPSATEFVPFGQGTRRCPGATLVSTEMKIFLAEMRRTPDLELLGADIPLRAVSLGSTLAPPPHILIHRTGEQPRPS